jgi:hypothetical protein
VELSESQLLALENLVNELLKAKPEESRIQSFLNNAGIDDPKDPVKRIQTVLAALHFKQPESEFTE